jgi:hypothetical protein
MLLVAGSTGLLGCGPGPDNVMAPNTAAPDPLPEGAYPEIVLLNGLEHVVVKEKPTVTGPTSEGPLNVRVPIRSVTDEWLRIEYRFMYSTADGEQLTTDPIWHQQQIAPRTRVFLQSNALSQRATKWQLEIRGH